ncbi:MAG: FHA domain-containing protein [Bacteroidales bacterium]|nr:FHA domain-containing protein [Bacteroidales bacterium]
MRLFLKYIVAVLVCMSAGSASSQDMSVQGVDDDGYPEIVARVRVIASVEDSIHVLEKGVNVACHIEESVSKSGDRGGKMHVFLIENSYYLHHNGVFPQIKRAVSRIGDYLDHDDNANILYFGPQGQGVRFISAEQTSDMKMLCDMTGYHLHSQSDSAATGNDLENAIKITMDYCIRHRRNYETIILTLISRGFDTGNVRQFASDFSRRAQDNGIYFNILMYNSESQNVKRELQDLASATDGCFGLFDAGNIEPSLAQSLEKIGKAKYKEYFKEYVVSFKATQSGETNSFTVNCGNTSVLCEYTNPGKSGLMGKHPLLVTIVIILIAAIAATIVFMRFRLRIIRRIDSRAQSHVDEIKRQNRMLKQEIEKYKRHPLSMAHKFDNIYVEETLIGAGKLVPKLVTMDGDRQQVFNITKLTMVIGRNDTCDIVLENRTVSGTHATLTNEGGFFYIADNDSTNGIFVNDIRIMKSKVSTDDRIRIGSVLAKIVY